MKKALYSVLLASAMMLGSCQGFLGENPTTSLSETSVYSTETALEAQIYGILSSFYGSYMMQGYMNEMLHTASGLVMWKGQRTQDNWIEGLKFAKYSDTTPNQTWYTQLYSAIACCNRLLDNIPASPVEESYKKEIEGEALFYRAVLYYYLVRLYGDVPLIVTCPKSIEDTNQPRTVYYKVYGQIIEDLTKAEAYMRDYARVEQVTPGKGRPCKWAATALKSCVYLNIGSMLCSYEADSEDQFFNPAKEGRQPDFKSIGINSATDAWNLCYQTAENVIENGPYALESDYRRLFRWTDPEDFNLKERIFVLQSTISSSPQNRLALMSLPIYPEGSSNKSIKNNNAGRYRPSRFLFQKFAADNGGVKSDEPDFPNLYVSCPDPRFDASFIHTTSKRLDTGGTLKIYPTVSAILTDDSSFSLPYYKKYLDPTFDANSGSADFYLLRLAEIYLNAAEAAAYLSSSKGDVYWQKALSRVEDLHRRARNSVDGTTPAEYPTWSGRAFADKLELADAIFWERCYEMCGEGHEYFDTHRMGAKWIARVLALPMNAFLQQPEQGPDPGKGVKGHFQYNYVGTLYPTDPVELRKSLMCAFPTVTEAVYNTAIDPVADQNDYYWR